MEGHFEKLYRAVITVSILLVVIFIAFFVSLLRQHRRHRALYQKSLRTEITTLEKERARMAADLHDEIAPLLAAAKLKLSGLDADQTQVDKVNTLIDQSMSRLREIAFNMMPHSLLRKGLAAAVMELVDAGNTGGLRVYIEEADTILTETQKIHLFRILQEIIYNTIKHAQATELRISVKSTNGKLLMTTADNGKGFNYAGEVRDGRGMGLHNIVNRVEMLNGEFNVESVKGKGTVFNFGIPVRS